MSKLASAQWRVGSCVSCVASDAVSVSFSCAAFQEEDEDDDHDEDEDDDEDDDDASSTAAETLETLEALDSGADEIRSSGIGGRAAVTTIATIALILTSSLKFDGKGTNPYANRCGSCSAALVIAFPSGI